MATSEHTSGLGFPDRFLKRLFDIGLSLTGLILFGWLIVLSILLATFDTRSFGLFVQTRIGQWGKPIKVYKIRTMKEVTGIDTTVTAVNDVRITPLGRVLRKFKLDELPQLVNVLFGSMSFVGPRPDVSGFADRLQGEDRIVLSVRPGITGPATLHFRNEEELLFAQEDPESYNREVIYPAKVGLNREYIENYSFIRDLHFIWRTILG